MKALKLQKIGVFLRMKITKKKTRNRSDVRELKQQEAIVNEPETVGFKRATRYCIISEN